MEEGKKSKNHLTSAAAFVEGGVQEACDDACSICLEAFCENEPSTVTGCKHEFHLQCILEWCQRSSQCPMCWQPINLKDPSSQELLDAIEQERSMRATPSRNSTIFHHPALGNFELQHLPVGVTDAELEERIIQQLAAAAGMGRARQIARREGRRNRSSAQGHPHFLVFSTTSNAPSSPAAFSPTQRGEGETASGNQPGVSSTDRSPSQTSLNSQDRAGTSELQSFSESLKSRINAMSMRYKESITKSTKGWKEKLFSRNTSPADSGSEVRGEVNVGVSIVSRTMERHETVESNLTPNVSVSNTSEDRSLPDQGNQQHCTETHHNSSLSDSNVQASFAATSAPN